MQKRRVGTISMAVVLIGFGVLIFISQVNKVSAVELAIKFWPAILFLIGGEILWAVYANKDEDIKVRYDVLSIFVVLIIVGINLVIYGLIETDMMKRFNLMLSSHTFNYQMSLNEIEVGEEIKKIVINPSSHSSLTVRTGKENKIISTGSLNITTDSEKKAKEFLDDEYIKVNKVGDIAYVSFIGRTDYDDGVHSISPYEFNLTIPEDRKVEISKVNELELILDGIKNDWVIDDVNQTKIRLGKDIDVKISAFVYGNEVLKGNAKWNIKENSGEGYSVQGELTYEEGENTINILNSHEVVVDELE